MADAKNSSMNKYNLLCYFMKIKVKCSTFIIVGQSLVFAEINPKFVFPLCYR